MNISSVLAVAGLLVFAGATALAAPGAPATPEVFGPGVISGPISVAAATFTPDGRTVFFDQSVGTSSTIMVSHWRSGHWSAPEIAPFSGTWADKDASMAPDGSFLVFGSNRPKSPGGKALDAVFVDGSVRTGKGSNLWRVDRKGAGWGEPVRLPDSVNNSGRIFSPSVVGDGSVYFQRPDPTSLTFHLWRSGYRDGNYQAPTPVAIGPAAADERDPAVAPDESFMVLSANYGGKGEGNRLYITFWNAGQWGKPVDLGASINHDGAEGPHLGPGSCAVYFDSNATTAAAWPRSYAQAQEESVRMARWDNGNSHLWRVELAPWFDAHRAAACATKGAASCGPAARHQGLVRSVKRPRRDPRGTDSKYPPCT